MRRALVTNEFAPSHGGVERLLYERSRGFHPEELTVFTAHCQDCEMFDKAQAFRICRAGRRFSGIPLIRDIARSLAPLYQCYRENRRRQFDVLECGQAFPACLLAWQIHRKYGTPYLVWVHGNDLLGPTRHRWLRPVMRKAMLRADAIIANSTYTAALVGKFGIPPGRIRIVAPTVDTRVFRPAPPSETLLERYGIRGQKVVLTVCRLVERKGVDRMLEAVSRLRTRGRDIKYLIVGDGPMREDLERLANVLDLGDHAIFAGTVPEAELPLHYNLASVFAMPSRFLPSEGSVEGLGLVYLEAMASGLPLVAGRSGGVPDIVLDGETGLLVDPASVDEITGAIDSILSDAALARKLGDNGLAFVQRTTDWRFLDLLQPVDAVGGNRQQQK